jgi:hypothetical protein
MDGVAIALEWAVMALVVPVWLCAGWADSACHRRLRIEESTGLPESLLHAVMLAELSVGALGALFLEINATGILILVVSCVSHEVTVWLDLAYATSRRKVPWFEQWVHGLQQALPWAVLTALAVLHRDQALAIFGEGPGVPEWQLRWKDVPLPSWYIGAFLVAALLLVVLPFAAELRRCWLTARRPAHL